MAAASELQEQVLSDVTGAAKMLSQALQRLHPSLDLYKSIHDVDDALDSVIMSLQEGDYDLEAGG